MRKIEMIDRRFGRLTVTRDAKKITRPDGYTILCVEVRCDCGKKKTVRAFRLRHGLKSCGCLRSEMVTAKNTTHGEATRAGKSAEYQAWEDMRKRCTNPNFKDFENWGGRGITVCDRWIDSYENFIADVGRRPTKRHTLDRKENEGNSEPTNCRGATRKQQANNQRPRRKRIAA